MGCLLERWILAALVVIAPDHGEEFKEHGRLGHFLTQYQKMLHVPLILRGPGVPKGVRISAPVSLVAPTGLAIALAFALAFASPIPARAERAAEPEANRIIVKFKHAGEHALAECAERLFLERRSFASQAADGSTSIDELNERFSVRRIRALMRRSDDRPLAEQRRAMQERIVRRIVSGNAWQAAGRAAQPIWDALPDLSHIYHVELGPEASLEQALESYAADPHVAYAQRDHSNDLDDLPSDPLLHSSGSWGQPYEDLWGLHRIRAPEAWEISRGEGVVVAVVDTGLDYLHPDIAENVWINAGEDLNGNGQVDASDWNGVDDDGNGFIDDLRGFDFADSIDANQDGDYDDPQDVNDPDPFDTRGHGTHVAGTIAAVADNGIGIVGVAPRALIMAVKGFPAEGSGLDSDLWRGVLYAAENGALVVNTSWSCSPECPHNPLAEDVLSLVHAMDVVVVTSAGNRSADVVRNSPENTSQVITVASSGQDDEPSSTFTNMGWLVDVAAPGGGPNKYPGIDFERRNILSLLSSGADIFDRLTLDGLYYRLSGTSMSAPHVSGVVALIRSAMPQLDYRQVRRLIRQSAADLGPPGHDRRMGAGRLDAYAALTHPPLPDLVAAITSPGPGSVLRPVGSGDETVVVGIEGSAAGSDLDSFELHYGIGNDPKEWLPIGVDLREPVEGGVLAHWPISELEEGTYVVRLHVRAVDGTQFSEFQSLSLERNASRQITHAPEGATIPAVSEGLVVWQSRSDAELSVEGTDDWNLFATDLADGEHFLVQDAPGDQRNASVDGSLIAWLDKRVGAGEIYGCQLDRISGACAEFSAMPGLNLRAPPAVAAGRIFWIDGTTGTPDIHGCLPDPDAGACQPFDLGLEPVLRSFLRGDGEGLVWIDRNQWISSCVVDAQTGFCPESRMASRVLAYSRPAASQNLRAWVEFEGQGGNPLVICQLEEATGDCWPITVAEDVSDATPNLSGNRLVWDDAVGDEEEDVFFCEFDRVRERCPVQRLTAQMGIQNNSAIHGNTIVWQDDRNGASQIFSKELAYFLPIDDHEVSEGSLLRIPLRAIAPKEAKDVNRVSEAPLDPPAGRHRKRGRQRIEANWSDSQRGSKLSLDAEMVGERSLEELGARFFDRGRGRGVLYWRPGSDQSGDYALTFSATDSAGLVTRHTTRIKVLDVNRPPVVRTAPWRIGQLGETLLLDACESFDPDGDLLTFAWTPKFHRRFHSRPPTLSDECSALLESPRWPSVMHIRVRVSDGRVSRTQRVKIVWLPKRIIDWWRASTF